MSIRLHDPVASMPISELHAKEKGRRSVLFLTGRADQAASVFNSACLTARFSALNRARKLAVVMFSSIPMPCSGRLYS